jgi:hypothetical protein
VTVGIVNFSTIRFSIVTISTVKARTATDRTCNCQYCDCWYCKCTVTVTATIRYNIEKYNFFDGLTIIRLGRIVYINS